MGGLGPAPAVCWDWVPEPVLLALLVEAAGAAAEDPEEDGADVTIWGVGDAGAAEAGLLSAAARARARMKPGDT